MAMKRHPNNSGSVWKLSGNRTRPYAAVLPSIVVWDSEKGKAIIKRENIGTFETESKAWKALSDYKCVHPERFEQFKKDIPVLPTAATVSELWEEFQKSKSYSSLSDSTRGNYQAAYNKHLISLHDTPITEIKTFTLSKVINNIDVKSGTKKNALTVMRKLMNIAISNDIIDKNYADYVEFDIDETEITREPFTKEELDKMWQHTDDWIFQLLLIMAYSGSRIKELLNVRKEDVHIDDSFFHISEGKNKFARRNVPIHSAILRLFNELMQNSSEYLISTPNGAKITPRRVQDRLQDIKKVTGKEHYVYDAKHTFITQCEICKVSKLAKINIIGHTPSGTSERVYTHLPVDELKKEIEKVIY